MASALSVVFDHAQTRHKNDRIGVLLGGLDANDIRFRTDTYVEPVTKSTILRPIPDYPNWSTSTTAPYTKLGLADFGSPAGIKIVDTSGSNALPHLSGDKNITLQTSSSYPKNQAWYVSGFSFSNGADGVLLEGGWSSGTDVSADTAFRIYNSGVCEVWRGGYKIEVGRVNGKEAPGQSQNNEIGLYFLPARGRELLIWSTQGAGFVTIMPDITEGTSDPTIVPAAKFWLRQPDVSTSLLVAPLLFATSGTAVSELWHLAEAPVNTDTFETWDNRTEFGGSAQAYKIFGEQSHFPGNTDAATLALVMPDGATAFVNDGTHFDCRLKFSLTGNGNSTPCIYGGTMAYKTVTADTNATEQYDATAFVVEASLEVPDGADGEKFKFTVIDDSDGTLASHVHGLKTQYNRPIQASIGTTHFHNGRSSVPTYERMRTHDVERITFECETTIKALKNYVFREVMAFDGLLLTHASNDCVIRRLLKLVGVPDSAMDLETATVAVGDIAPEECGTWSEFAEVGSNAWEVLCRFMDDYLGGWHFGTKPTASGIKFVVKSPATLAASTSLVTLYWTTAAAIAAGISSDDAWKYVIRKHVPSIVEAESNEVIITGLDLRSGLTIGSIKRDSAAQDPTTAPSLRPSNWKGEIARTGVTNRGINTQPVADGSAVIISNRLFPTRYLDELECEFLIVDGVPVWRGDKITIDGIGDRIVQSLSGTYVKEPTDSDAWQWRPFTYVGSNVMGSTGAVDALRIASIEKHNASNRNVQRRNSAIGVLRRGSLVVS